MRLGDVTVWVEIDGVRVDEYGVRSDHEAQTSRCYISSQAGKHFSIHWDCTDRYLNCRGSLVVDGRKCWSGKGRGHQSIECMTIGMNLIAPLKFAEIESTDDETLELEDERVVNAIGMIELVTDKGTRERNGTVVPPPPKPDPGAVCYRTKPIHERMKKNGGHRVIPGHAMEGSSGYVRRRFIPDGSGERRFKFYYRPEAKLLADGIIRIRDLARPPTSPRALNDNKPSLHIPRNLSPAPPSAAGPSWGDLDAPWPDPRAGPSNGQVHRPVSGNRRSGKRHREESEESEDAAERMIQVVGNLSSPAGDAGVLKRPKREPEPERAWPFTPGEIVDLTLLPTPSPTPPPRPFQPGELIDLTTEDDDHPPPPATTTTAGRKKDKGKSRAQPPPVIDLSGPSSHSQLNVLAEAAQKQLEREHGQGARALRAALDEWRRSGGTTW